MTLPRRRTFRKQTLITAGGIGLLLILALGIRAQDAAFSSDVRVVTLQAIVRDRSGAVVRNLTKDDFRVEDDGHLQTIRYFSHESDLPLTAALLVDTSRSMQSVFEPERVASNRFFEQVLRDDRDAGAVIHFDMKVGVLQTFTSSREQLAAALAKLRIPARRSTLLYDAIGQTSQDLMRQRSGRKSFILLSDGVDVRSQTTIGTAIEYAQRADTMIYSILFDHAPSADADKFPINIGPGLRRGALAMKRLARETGGRYFAVSDAEPIDGIYAQIEEELRNEYSIGYTPDKTGSNQKFRKLKLTTVRKDLAVRTRDGYYPK